MPIPEDIDEGQLAIQLAPFLWVPAADVHRQPPLWIRNAMIARAIEGKRQERARKQAAERKRKSAQQSRTKRR